MRVLAPKEWKSDIRSFLRDARSRVCSPFASNRLAVLEDVSRRILRHARLRRDPAGAALGFWLRRAHLAELRLDFQQDGRASRCVVPAGLVLHIAPANVDTMFVFSWALSFLAGNANVVRLTSRSSPLMEDLIDCLDEAFAGAPEASAGNLFVSYGHDDATTAMLSEACDTRIIWGGDETVRRLRRVPLNPAAADRAFASKRSLSVIDSAAWLNCDAAARDALAGKMAVDIAPFGQLACSSPHVVYWIGGIEDAAGARDDFFNRLQPAMSDRLGRADLGWATRRLNHAFAAAARGQASGFVHQPHITTVFASDVGTAEPGDVCGAGLLTHARVSTLAEVARQLRTDHQTITYFGLSPAELAQFAPLAGRQGVDRIVPIGRALDFGAVWDGYNLWNDLTRLVDIQ